MGMIFEHQQYQEDCVNNIVKVLGDSNNLTNFDSLKENIERLQAEKNIPSRLKDISNEPRLDVLMETGTGKTFTYLKTMFELNKHYGKNKFIVFVPRLPIREGIIQNIELTKSFFRERYRKEIKVYTYEGRNTMHSIRNFTDNQTSKDLSVLILTSQSIATKEKGKRILTTYYDGFNLGYKSPLDAIAKQKPVIFIDEPHLLKGAQFTNVYDNYFSNCLYLRFGATFPEKKNTISNVVYVLDSISAFKKCLVKGIAVRSVEDEVEKEDFKEKQPTEFTIKKMIQSAIKSHFEKEKELFGQGIKTLSLFFIPGINDFRGDNPRIKRWFEEGYKKQRTNILNDGDISSEYRSYLEKDFDADGNLCVHEGYFSGDSDKEGKVAKKVNLILKEKEKLLSTKTPLRFIFSVWALQEGWDNPNIFNICKIAPTQREISKRQQVGRGLRLAVNQDGVRQTLEYCGDNQHNFQEINTLDVIVSGQEKNFISEIQQEVLDGSYTLGGDILTFSMITSVGLGETQAFELVSFLKEKGVIEDDVSGNWKILSPIAPFLEKEKNNLPAALTEHYENLIREFNSAAGNYIKKRTDDMVGIKKENFKEFEDLWHTIIQKAKIVYSDIRDGEIIQNIADGFSKENISEAKTIITRKRYDANKNEIIDEGTELTKSDYFSWEDDSYANLVKDFSISLKLPLPFVSKLFSSITDKDKIKKNPALALKTIERLYKDKIHSSIIQSVGYEFDGEINTKARKVFYKDNGEPKEKIEGSILGKYLDKSNPEASYLYDEVRYDSTIELNSIIENFSTLEDEIMVFAKLPKISIPTPYRSYSPDFAYFIKTKQKKQIFFVVETKGYDTYNEIPSPERDKISYGKKFFEALNNKTKKENPNLVIKFATRINRDSLRTLLEQIGTEQ